MAEFIAHPYEALSVFQPAECALKALGISVATKISEETSQKQINAALEVAIRAGAQHLASDLCRIAMERGLDIDAQAYVRGILIPELELLNSSYNAKKLCFQECFFERIGIDPDVDPDRLPRFEGCYIDELDGRLSGADLPEVFSRTVRFSISPLGAKLPTKSCPSTCLWGCCLLTILKKLYQRRGSGRREGALHRGLDHRSEATRGKCAASRRKSRTRSAV